MKVWRRFGEGLAKEAKEATYSPGISAANVIVLYGCMSSRLTYANGAAVLVDFIRECEQCAPAGVVGDDAAIEYIAAWLADGGSMPGLCERYSLNWGVLTAWIRRSPERDARYRQAMLDRRAMRRERLLDGWWATAGEVPEDGVTHGDVHKARESLAKAEGLYSEAASVKVDTQVTIIHESQ